VDHRSTKKEPSNRKNRKEQSRGGNHRDQGGLDFRSSGSRPMTSQARLRATEQQSIYSGRQPAPAAASDASASPSPTNKPSSIHSSAVCHADDAIGGRNAGKAGAEPMGTLRCDPQSVSVPSPVVPAVTAARVRRRARKPLPVAAAPPHPNFEPSRRPASGRPRTATARHAQARGRARDIACRVACGGEPIPMNPLQNPRLRVGFVGAWPVRGAVHTVGRRSWHRCQI